MKFGPKAALSVAAIAGVLTLGTSAHASFGNLTFSKCLSAKIKQSGKGVGAYTGCNAKGASKNIATDPLCVSKASGKSVAAYNKADLKPPCETTGDAVARDTDAKNYANAVDTAVGHGSPGPVPNNNKCDAAVQKLVGKYVAAITGCYAKSAGKLGTAPMGINVDPLCISKADGKLSVGLGKAEAKPPCSGTIPQYASLKGAADAFLDAHTCSLDPTNPACTALLCGNGLNDPGEKCDASAPSAGWATCGSTFTCTSCNCACPTKVHFAGTATDPLSILDTGWTGISHRAPIISGGDVSVNVSCSASSRPCGTCTISGPITNASAGAGQHDNRRCSHDPSIKCTSNPICGGGNTCEYYFGSFLPLAAGGVTSCVLNRFNGSVSGTANIENGEAATVATLASAVYLGTTVDNPCARCVGDPTPNDGANGGTCSGGSRNGLPCDGNGSIPGRPDFGVTSLDCPMSVSPLTTLAIDLTNATDPVTKTLSAGSPKCTASGFGAQNCLCDTCNNLAQTACDSNADCVAAGATVCGGKRCLGGTNGGAPCVANSECPGGGACSRPGTGTAPSGCQDNTGTGILDCLEDAGSGEGTCTEGPVDNNCSAASGHPQRGCITDTDCSCLPASGCCTTNYRRCFLTGGLGEATGTNTLTAVGMESAPMADTSTPTLGAVFCVGPTGLGSIDNVAGLPGPGRVTIKGQAEGRP